MTMTREELKGKQTPGEVSTYQSVEWNEDTGGTIVLNANSWSAFAHIYQHCVGKKYITEGRANAALYAEAHNVANRTGMWPEDLVARVKELEEALKQAKAMMNEARSLADAGGEWDALHAPGTLEQGIREIDATLNKQTP